MVKREISVTAGGKTVRQSIPTIRQAATVTISTVFVLFGMRTPIPDKRWPYDAIILVGYGLLSHLLFAPDPWSGINVCISIIFLAAQATAAYAHLYWALSARLSNTIGWGAYVLKALVSLLAGILLTYPLLWLLAALFSSFGAYFDNAVYLTSWVPKIFWSTLTVVAITTGVHLFARQRREATRQQILEKEKATTELAYLRGQLNPHFLFNVLNSIHVLIRKDPGTAADALAGFSDLLRYQLYRAEQDLVPLEEEVAHLRQFATLSRYRMEEDFVFDLETSPAAAGLLPPMLLQPLLENAFKYSARVGGWVKASLRTRGGRLQYTVTNRIGSFVTETAVTEVDGGIGLQNIRRRLDLLYPDRYSLTTNRDTDIFTAELQLPLS